MTQIKITWNGYQIEGDIIFQEPEPFSIEPGFYYVEYWEVENNTEYTKWFKNSDYKLKIERALMAEFESEIPNKEGGY